MQYMLLLYTDEGQFEGATPEQIREHMQGYAEVAKDIADRGILKLGAPLRRTAAATTVRVRGGKAITVDGPFAETKEQLGGFFLVDCGDLDEAIELASRLPAAHVGSVEIRPVLDESGP